MLYVKPSQKELDFAGGRNKKCHKRHSGKQKELKATKYNTHNSYQFLLEQVYGQQLKKGIFLGIYLFKLLFQDFFQGNLDIIYFVFTTRFQALTHCAVIAKGSN